MKVSDVYAAAGIDVQGGPMREEWFRARCAECGKAFDLNEVETETTEAGGIERTAYACPEGCATPLVVVNPGPNDGEGGYMLGGNVLRPSGGLWAQSPAMQQAVYIPPPDPPES